MTAMPLVIQGGMGVGISSWLLARTVASLGPLGVVSGTALDVSLARRLQLGDPGGHIRRALAHFPVPEIAQRVWDRFFIAGGKQPEDPFAPTRMHTADSTRAQQELTIVANFVEVRLAREGHSGLSALIISRRSSCPFWRLCTERCWPA